MGSSLNNLGAQLVIALVQVGLVLPTQKFTNRFYFTSYTSVIDRYQVEELQKS